ncbi:MAG: DUF1223 domain-containing protein [bacterium]
MNQKVAFFIAILTLSIFVPARAEMDKSLILVEMFTSQGCPYSPTGDNNMPLLEEHENILALTFPVTYWDMGGWKDTLARQIYDERQKRYIRHMPGQWLYTPQAVIQGQIGTSGAKIEDIMTAIDQVQQQPQWPVQAFWSDDKSEVTIASTHQTPPDTDYLVILYNPRPITVNITDGKNKGKTLTYHNVVENILVAEQEKDNSTRVTIPEPQRDGFGCVALLQDRMSGQILAATTCSF